jgi:hypothetical protein
MNLTLRSVNDNYPDIGIMPRPGSVDRVCQLTGLRSSQEAGIIRRGRSGLWLSEARKHGNEPEVVSAGHKRATQFSVPVGSSPGSLSDRPWGRGDYADPSIARPIPASGFSSKGGIISVSA